MTDECLEFNVSTEKELVDCFDSLRKGCVKTDILVNRVFEYWNIFKNKVYYSQNKHLQIPSIIFDPIFPTITFFWDNTDDYLYCDILEDGSFEFNYYNRKTKERLGEDYHPGENTFPEKAFELLLKFSK